LILLLPKLPDLKVQHIHVLGIAELCRLDICRFEPGRLLHLISLPAGLFKALNSACIACLYMVVAFPTITESSMLKWAFAHFFIF